MPTYAYRCLNCGKEVELLQKISDRVRPPCDVPTCPGRGAEMEPVLGSPSFILKGSGWAKDGYSGGGKK